MASINTGKGIKYSGSGKHGDRRLRRLNTRQARETEALEEYEESTVTEELLLVRTNSVTHPIISLTYTETVANLFNRTGDCDQMDLAWTVADAYCSNYPGLSPISLNMDGSGLNFTILLATADEALDESYGNGDPQERWLDVNLSEENLVQVQKWFKRWMIDGFMSEGMDYDAAAVRVELGDRYKP